jgi:hypothetical protein
MSRFPRILALVCAFALAGANVCSAQDSQNELRVGRFTLILSPGCKVRWHDVRTGAKGELDAALPYPETCAFIKAPDSKFVRVERYFDASVMLIESHKKVDAKEADPRFGCDTRFKGLIARDDGKLFLNPEKNGGSGCPPIDRGRLAYTVVADPFVNKRKSN